MNEKIFREEKFHDRWAATLSIEELKVEEYFEACTAPENRHIIKNLGNLEGKNILELGCGAGEAAVYLAKKGATVVASDISTRMLEIVEKLAEKHNVSLKTIKFPTDKIQYPNGYFDIVYAANVLHHVDIENTLKEVRRVLKEGGIFVSWDPLAHNPIINIYRRITNSVRTADEQPLRMRQVKLFTKYFERVETKGTWFFALWVFIRFYLFENVDPNKDRYWKKIISEHERLKNTYCKLEKIDLFILKYFPFFKRYCWNIVIISR